MIYLQPFLTCKLSSRGMSECSQMRPSALASRIGGSRLGITPRQHAADLRRAIDIPAQWGGQPWPDPLAVDPAASFISAKLGSLKGWVSATSSASSAFDSD